MSLRRAIVEANTRELNVTEFCRCHGVSTWFFWELRRRYAVEGDVVLTPKSRAPHHPAGRTPADVEDAIVAKRKELDDAGLDCWCRRRSRSICATCPACRTSRRSGGSSPLVV